VSSRRDRSASRLSRPKCSTTPALLQVNPEYLGSLLSLPTLERERLLGGNWKIRPAAGLYFKREWCTVVDAVAADLDVVRYWDLAATEKTEFNDPDWTVGIKLGRDHNGGHWLLDMVRHRANPGDVERILMNIATQDGKPVRIGFGKDPGQAGKSQAPYFVRALSKFTVTSASESGDKLTRFGPFSSQCRAGNVKIQRGSWNEELFRVLEGFPDLAHDDEVDACSGALEMLNPPMKGWGFFELQRQRAEEVMRRNKPTPEPEFKWAIGSMEYEQQQREIEERAQREREAQEAKPALANPGALTRKPSRSSTRKVKKSKTLGRGSFKLTRTSSPSRSGPRPSAAPIEVSMSRIGNGTASQAGPVVRIRFPPAVSLSQQVNPEAIGEKPRTLAAVCGWLGT
jgi:predicted phage terminase large subunit-like protein